VSFILIKINYQTISDICGMLLCQSLTYLAFLYFIITNYKK